MHEDVYRSLAHAHYWSAKASTQLPNSPSNFSNYKYILFVGDMIAVFIKYDKHTACFLAMTSHSIG